MRFRGVSVTDVAMPLALLVRAPASRTGIPGSRPALTSCGSVDPGGYIYIYIYILNIFNFYLFSFPLITATHITYLQRETKTST